MARHGKNAGDRISLLLDGCLMSGRYVDPKLISSICEEWDWLGAMAIETESVEIENDPRPESKRNTKELVEALAEVAKARSMRDLQRYSKQRQVHCTLRVPLLKGSYPVQSAELGRALRKFMRATVDASQPGDYVLVDFVVASDSHLVVKAGPASEMGLDSSVLKPFFSD